MKEERRLAQEKQQKKAWISFFTYATIDRFRCILLELRRFHEWLFTWNNLPDQTIAPLYCLLPVPFEPTNAFKSSNKEYSLVLIHILLKGGGKVRYGHD